MLNKKLCVSVSLRSVIISCHPCNPCLNKILSFFVSSCSFKLRTLRLRVFAFYLKFVNNLRMIISGSPNLKKCRCIFVVIKKTKQDAKDATDDELAGREEPDREV